MKTNPRIPRFANTKEGSSLASSAARSFLSLPLLALSMLAAASAALAQKPPAGPAAPAPTAAGASAELAVTARLVEIPTKFPPDDLYDYAYVMRYEVVGGPMDKQSILVAQYKPRQPRSKIADQMKSHVAGKVRSFKQGDVHKLQLTPNLKAIWKGALVDEFAASDRKSVRYWALATDPA